MDCVLINAVERRQARDLRAQALSGCIATRGAAIVRALPLAGSVLNALGWTAWPPLLAGLLLASCRLIATADITATGERRRDPNGAGGSIPTRWSAAIWSTKVVPYFEKKAGPFARGPRPGAPNRPTRPARNIGYRAKSEDTPWTLMVKLDGVIVAADTESRAATISVDATARARPTRSCRSARDARHRAARRARFRLVQRFHQPDRLRPLRQGVQRLCQSRRPSKSCRATPGRAEGDGARRLSVRIRQPRLLS